MKRNLVRGVLAVATTVLVAGCGSSTGTANAPSTPPGAPAAVSATTAGHNAADTVFVQGMIPHHSQAVQMSETAAQRAVSPQVKQLATRIQQAQGPEIEQMRRFLAAWGEPETGGADTSDSMGGVDHGSMGGTASSMPMSPGASGMMTDQEMVQLGRATGTAFDRMFLQMMTEHHKGAIEMARTELAAGQNPDVKALAQKITDAQQAEITEMQNLLSTL